MARVQSETSQRFSNSNPSNCFPPRHLLRHGQDQSHFAAIHATEQAAELDERACLFARTAPQIVVNSLALQEIRQLGWLWSVVEKLIHRNFEGAGKLLKRFDVGD